MDEKHYERLVTGGIWAFLGLMASLIFDGLGYGIVVSLALGVVFVPVFVIAMYVLGVVGMWLAEHSALGGGE